MPFVLIGKPLPLTFPDMDKEQYRLLNKDFLDDKTKEGENTNFLKDHNKEISIPSRSMTCFEV